MADIKLSEEQLAKIVSGAIAEAAPKLVAETIRALQGNATLPGEGEDQMSKWEAEKAARPLRSEKWVPCKTHDGCTFTARLLYKKITRQGQPTRETYIVADLYDFKHPEPIPWPDGFEYKFPNGDLTNEGKKWLWETFRRKWQNELVTNPGAELPTHLRAGEEIQTVQGGKVVREPPLEALRNAVG